MSRKPRKCRPSFFKVMVKDYKRYLQLPPGFVEKYGDILPENARLRVKSGLTWDVELELVDEVKCCFTKGWTKFAGDVCLEMGEFLVFWFSKGTSTFDVSVCGINGCERVVSAVDSSINVSDCDDDEEEEDVKPGKDLVAWNNREVTAGKQNCGSSRDRVVKNEGESSNGDEEADDCGSEEAYPQFKFVLKEHNRYRMVLRKDLAVAAGLMEERAVVLKYHTKQCHWPVLLCHPANVNYYRLEMGTGWSEFWKKNGMKMGKTYLFEYIQHTNVIQVKPLVD